MGVAEEWLLGNREGSSFHDTVHLTIIVQLTKSQLLTGLYDNDGPVQFNCVCILNGQ